MNPPPRRHVPIVSIALALALLMSVLLGVTMASSARAATSLPAFPLSTSGSKIVDANGNEVVLQGVNWFGFETGNHAPHGLWSRDYKDMLAQIKSEGFNVIRLPFSLQALNSTTTSGIEYANGKNAALQGKTPQQAMDVIIDEAARQGLMVILDNHSQADDGFMYDVWYGQNGFTEDQWVNAWSALATRYANTPNVIAADLKNEPHGSATWGTGTATDWRRAAERAGNAVLASNPRMLVMVEGIEGPCVDGNQLDRHWWGGNLECVRTNPVRLNVAHKLVYSPHEYGPGVFAQPWFSDPNVVSILADRWQKGFGYIADQQLAPILVGEFGAKNVGLDTVEGRWIRQFADYMSAKGTSWTFWAWNPNSGDTGGVLDNDWLTVIPAKMELLSQLIARKPIPYSGTLPTPTPTPTPTASSTPTPTPTASPTVTASPTATTTAAPGGVSTKFVLDSSWNSGWCGKLVVENRSAMNVKPSTWSFTLPSSTTISSNWNSTVSRSGTTVIVTAPNWASAPANGSYSDTGLCGSGTAQPANLVVSLSGGATVSPTASPSATPTPTQSPSQTPTPTPVSGITATWSKDSTWSGGYCRSLTVKNATSNTVKSWQATFSIPANDIITQTWSGTVTRSANTITVKPAAWALQLNPNASVTSFGYCANGIGEPSVPALTIG